MKNILLVRAAIAAALVVVSAVRAPAQISEAVGIRAQGMGGAFTAVADDATAAWWNPGGLAAGAYFNTIIETSSQRQPASKRAVPAWQSGARGFAIAYPALALSYYRLQSGARGFAIAYPALALSYYRLRVSEIQPLASTAGASAGRQDQGSADIRLRSLVLSQFGATVGQSLGNHLVVASTLKLVRGSVATDVRPASAASLDAAADLDGTTEMHAGLDVGAMAKFGPARVGLMVRNARETTFGDGEQAIMLDRHVRAGVAVSSRSNLATAAADVDLTTTMLPTGEERRVAAGVEAWGPTRRIGVRAGMSLNTIGDARVSVSGGVSAAVRTGTFVDVAAAVGSDESRRGWGLAFRVTF